MTTSTPDLTPVCMTIPPGTCAGGPHPWPDGEPLSWQRFSGRVPVALPLCPECRNRPGRIRGAALALLGAGGAGMNPAQAAAVADLALVERGEDGILASPGDRVYYAYAEEGKPCYCAWSLLSVERVPAVYARLRDGGDGDRPDPVEAARFRWRAIERWGTDPAT